MGTGSTARSQDAPAQRAQDAPTACSLSAADAARQRDTFSDLCRRALLDVDRDDASVTFRFRDEDGVRRELDEFVGVERGCCGFLDFAVERGEGAAVLRIAAGEGTPAQVLHAMYGPPERA